MKSEGIFLEEDRRYFNGSLKFNKVGQPICSLSCKEVKLEKELRRSTIGVGELT